MDKQHKTETIEQYIAGFPEDIQDIMQLVRQTIQAAAPQAEESISWEMPTFKVGKILVQFAGHKNHLGFYSWPETIETFKEKLSGYKTTKGGIQFPYNKPVPLKLIAEMVAFRLKILTEKDNR